METEDIAHYSTMPSTVPSRQRITRPQMSTVSRFRNPDLGQRNAGHHELLVLLPRASLKFKRLIGNEFYVLLSAKQELSFRWLNLLCVPQFRIRSHI